MRAREFTINVPITIKINGDDDPQIDMPSSNDNDDAAPFVSPLQHELELKKAQVDKTSDDAAPFVSPLQQELELKKAQVGKTSDVIDDLTDNDDEERLNESYNELVRLMELIKK